MTQNNGVMTLFVKGHGDFIHFYVTRPRANRPPEELLPFDQNSGCYGSKRATFEAKRKPRDVENCPDSHSTDSTSPFPEEKLEAQVVAWCLTSICLSQL